MNNQMPTDIEIKKVQEETGMDYIQARNHLISRKILKEKAEKEAFESYLRNLKAFQRNGN